MGIFTKDISEEMEEAVQLAIEIAKEDEPKVRNKKLSRLTTLLVACRWVDGEEVARGTRKLLMAGNADLAILRLRKLDKRSLRPWWGVTIGISALGGIAGLKILGALWKNKWKLFIVAAVVIFLLRYLEMI